LFIRYQCIGRYLTLSVSPHQRHGTNHNWMSKWRRQTYVHASTGALTLRVKIIYQFFDPGREASSLHITPAKSQKMC
jgi:hypothetical protein